MLDRPPAWFHGTTGTVAFVVGIAGRFVLPVVRAPTRDGLVPARAWLAKTFISRDLGADVEDLSGEDIAALTFVPARVLAAWASHAATEEGDPRARLARRAGASPGRLPGVLLSRPASDAGRDEPPVSLSFRAAHEGHGARRRATISASRPSERPAIAAKRDSEESDRDGCAAPQWTAEPDAATPGASRKGSSRRAPSRRPLSAGADASRFAVRRRRSLVRGAPTRERSAGVRGSRKPCVPRDGRARRAARRVLARPQRDHPRRAGRRAPWRRPGWSRGRRGLWRCRAPTPGRRRAVPERAVATRWRSGGGPLGRRSDESARSPR